MIFYGSTPRHAPCASEDCLICAATDFEQVAEDRAEARGIGLWAEDAYSDHVMREPEL